MELHLNGLTYCISKCLISVEVKLLYYLEESRIVELRYFNHHDNNHLFFITNGHLQCPESFHWSLQLFLPGTNVNSSFFPIFH